MKFDTLVVVVDMYTIKIIPSKEANFCACGYVGQIGDEFQFGSHWAETHDI